VHPHYRSLWRDLYGVIVFDGPAPILVRQTGRSPVLATVTRGSPTQKIGPRGPIWTYDGVDDFHSLNTVATDTLDLGIGAGNFSFLAVMRPVANGDTSCIYFAATEAGSSNDFKVAKTGTGTQPVQIGVWDTTFRYASFGINSNDANWWALLFTYNNSTRLLRTFRNGTFQNTTTLTGARGTTKSQTFGIGGLPTAGTADCNAEFQLIVPWNRDLTDDEARWVTRDPFGPFLRYQFKQAQTARLMEEYFGWSPLAATPRQDVVQW
jgi:hypothetical protein